MSNIQHNKPKGQSMIINKQTVAVDEDQQHYEESAPVKTQQLLNTWLLIQKNIILTIRNPKSIIFLIIAPFVLTGFMFFFQKMADVKTHESWIDNPITPLPLFSQCYGDKCVSLQYMTLVPNQTQTVGEDSWISHTINYIKNKSSVTNMKDRGSISTVDDWKKYREGLQENPNITQIGILFCSDQLILIPQFICNTQRSYFLILNKTDSFGTIFGPPNLPAPTDPFAVGLKVLIDNAIIDYQTSKNFSEPRIQLSTQQYPVVPNRFLTGFDMVTQAGAFYYMITPLFAFLFIQSEIVREKEYKLRQGLNVFGASHFSYWFSWFLVSIFYSIITSVSTIAAGLSFGFGFFTQTPFFLLMAFLFPFCLAMQLFSYFISTVVPTLKTANSISYGFVLFAIVVESFLADAQLLALIFNSNPGGLIKFLKYFLSLYPPFSYTKIFAMITQYSGNHFSTQTNMWVTGTGYTWDLFMKEKTGKTITKEDYTEYSAFYSMLILYLNVLVWGILAWYFDNVLESNRGRSQSPIFFLKPSYWCRGSNKKQSKKPLSIDDLRNPNFNIHDQEESVIRERSRVMKNSLSKLPVQGMRIKNLSKTFKSTCSKQQVKALSNISLEIEGNELMSLLGHNGAGKTTMINILTGISNPDAKEGLQIIINNKSITNISEVRKYIGVCPQFDILWRQMTAFQHLRLFARLKQVSAEQLQEKIDDILRFVSLLKEKHSKVGSFSGGMKRRLSLAVAAVGNPKIIFLDEPTTGLDPKVRQQVWTLIQRLKRHKSIILTTHSMQEADFLSDRISILVKGKLKCIGTSIFLKETYGSGYRIALNIVQKSQKQIMKNVKKLFPEAVQIDSNGGNLLIGLQTYESLIGFVKMLESKEASGLEEYNIKHSIKDWNVSHTTLQEVFMKVTKQEENKIQY